jgi:hypothetical protein
MLYLKEEKVCICGLAYVLSPQITKKNSPANPSFGRSANQKNY